LQPFGRPANEISNGGVPPDTPNEIDTRLPATGEIGVKASAVAVGHGLTCSRAPLRLATPNESFTQIDTSYVPVTVGTQSRVDSSFAVHPGGRPS
jgi:hypothetical protein